MQHLQQGFGGKNMESAEYWKIFLETGLPEAYMLYTHAKRMELNHVSDYKSFGIANHRLQ